MKTFGRGISTTGIIVAVVVLAVVGFGGAYFFSDVFRTRADATVEQWTKWTPENIAKDPVNYLNFCEKQTNLALEKCKSSKVAIAQKRGTIDSMLKDANGKIAAGTKGIDELKVLYKEAEEKSAFPFKWKGKDFSKDDGKRQIMGLAKEVKDASELKTKLEGAIAQLAAQEGKLAQAEGEAKAQLAKISTNRELLKVQQITESLKTTLVDMKGAIESSVVSITNSESSTISLSELTASSESSVNDDEFNKIMNEK